MTKKNAIQPGDRVLVLGLGVSGRSSANFCAEQGARVVAADERPADELEGLDSLDLRVEVEAGGSLPSGGDHDWVVPSPGVPPERYRASGARIAGDVELAGLALQVPIVAVTGTNGKSTTVRMIEAMLNAAGIRARAAGNVGTPALSLVAEPLDVAVLEVSSFQLETTERFHPRVAVVLNITPDHLDRHGSFEAYVAAKRNLVRQLEPGDHAVLDAGNEVSGSFAAHTAASILMFGTVRDPSVIPDGAWRDGEALVLKREGQLERFPLDGFPLAGRHNRENAAAALAAVSALDVDVAKAVRGLVDFTGLPHRCQLVARDGGISWVDDSKATNPGAAVRSLEAFAAPVVWIAGGRDKSLDFTPLSAACRGRVREALLIGESAATLEQVLAGQTATRRCESMEDAVAHAYRRAEAGDVVLLAPACASFDQFSSYEERGERFRSAVQNTLGRKSIA
ncbi:MAG: UDP-N-acetylmuramoyl-L-alanine--D-glutamate ligase [Myxococcota bacterium]